ncbi:interleukin-like EMT inducer domain-containing protein [uncultured Acinetobacter sp.]|uniref:interleukin-like EMT inducer domain-containing protein n=1 Tax=uncultured Acinetobacter sp. TaxID=165433 RepID=UPI00374A12BC
MSNGILKQIRAKKTGSVKAGSSPVGAIPSVADPTLQAWIKSISQEVDAASKKYVRTSELAKAGLIDENGQINIPGANEDENSTIVPKAVLNLSATGGYSAITLTWDTVNSKFFEKNEVYRAESDDFGKAINIGSTVGNVYTDYIGNSVKGFYWVRSVSKGGVLGELSKSVFAETSIDIDYLIESLQGQVNEGTLSKTLMSKIEVIDDLSEDVIKLNADAKQIKEDTKNAINELITDIDANQNKAAQEANAIREKFNSEIFTLNNNIGTEIEKRRQDSILLSNGVNHAQTTADNVTNDLINYKSSVENSFANVQDKIKVATEENTANAEKITQIDSSLKGTDFKAATALQTAQTAVNETQSLASQTQALRANIGAAVLSSIPQVEQPNKFAALVVTRSADVSPNQIPSYEHLANRTVILASYLTKDQLFNTSGMDGSIGFFRAIIFVAETKTVLIQGLVGDDAHAVYLDTKLKYSSVVQTTNNPQDVTLELLAGWHTLDFAFNNKSGGWGIKYNNSISGQVNEFYASTIDFVDKANSSYVEQIEATANQAETTANTAMMHMSALFSNVGDATAQISEIKQTKANKNEVSSIVQTALQSVWQSDAAAAVSSLQIGGVNLVRYSAGKFQPQRNTIDNYEYDVAHALLENGQTYTVSAKSNGVFTATHYASDGESDRATVWISSPDGSNLKVISNENTATTGTTFVWDGQSGWCPIRVNGYKADNSTWVSNIQIERGTKRTDWKQSPYDFEWTVINSGAANLNDFYKTSGKWFIQTGAINAPIAPWLYLIVERAGDDRVIQTVYRDMDASQGRWTRFLFNGTWSVWTKLATGKDLNDLSANISQTYQTKTDAQQAIASLTQQIDTKAGKDALDQTNANILNNYATKSNVSESVATATQTLTSSFQTADQNVLNSAAQDATNKANDAKTAAAQDASTKANNAINTASQDATSKANNAVNVAAQDATNKANNAIAVAAADATVKANNATTQANAFTQNYSFSKSEVNSAISGSLQIYDASVTIGGNNLYRGSKDWSGTWNSKWAYDSVNEEYKGLKVLRSYSNWSGIQQEQYFDLGVSYTLSAWIRKSAADVPIHFWGDYLAGDAGVGTQKPMEPNVWTRVTHTFKGNGQVGNGRFERVQNGTGGFYDICGLKLERGSKATDWSPNPNDAIDSLVLGGRNLFNRNVIYQEFAGANVVAKYSSGFDVWGVGENNAVLRLYNMAFPAGDCVISFDHFIGTAPFNLTFDVNDGAEVSFTAQHGWRHYEIVVKNTVERTDGWLDIGGLTGQQHQFRNFMVEKGNKATAYKPAPEDTDYAIQQVQANLTNFQQAQATVDQAQTDRLNSAESRLGSNESRINSVEQTKASKTEVSAIVSSELSSTWKNDAQNIVNNLVVGGNNLIQSSELSQSLPGMQSPAQGYDVYGFNVVPSLKDKSLSYDTALTMTLWYKELRDGFGINKPFNSAPISQDWGIRFHVSDGVFSREGDYYKWVGTIMFPANRAFNPVLRLIFEDSSQTSGCRIARVKLEFGVKSTGYTQASEDTTDTFKALDSHITNTYQTKSNANETTAILTQSINSKTSPQDVNSALANRLDAKDITYRVNLNDMRNVGIYLLRGGWDSGAYSSDNQAWHWLEVKGGIVEGRVIQTMWPDNSTGIVTNRAWNGTWSDWNTFANTQQVNGLRADVQNTYSTKTDTTNAIAQGINAYKVSQGSIFTYKLSSLGLGNAGWAGINNAIDERMCNMGRSYGLADFYAGQIVSFENFDLFQGGKADELADRINAIPDNHYVAIITYDEPATGRTDKLRQAFVSIGGTSEAFNRMTYRGAYILVGRKGLREGGGLELISDGKNIEYILQFINGVPVGVGGNSSSAQQTASNASVITQTKAQIGDLENNLNNLAQITTTLTSTVAKLGSASSNLLKNSDFSSGLDNWSYWSNIGGGTSIRNPPDDWAVVADESRTAEIHVGGNSNTGGYACIGQTVPIVAGKWYQFSGFTGVHRASYHKYVLYWNDLSGNRIGSQQIDATMWAGGKRLSDYYNAYFNAQAPSNAVSATCEVGCGGGSDVYMFMTRFNFCQVANADTTLIPWSPSAFGLAPLLQQNKVTLQQQMQVLDGMKALAAFRIDNNGAFAGWGVASELLKNGQVFSEIGFQADRFFFMAPDGKSYPFIIDNGKSVFNSDVYIRNGSIKSAQIGELGADKITSGDIAADRMRANIVEAVQGKFQNLSSLTARIGHLRSADSGRRFEITEEGMFSYDENNRLRGFFGARRQ